MSKTNINRRRGKDHQKKTADLLGGCNVGTLGGEDIFTQKYSVECKSRKAFVGFNWIEQARRNNKKEKIPIVVIHLHGARYKDDLVMLSMEDFLKLDKGE